MIDFSYNVRQNNLTEDSTVQVTFEEMRWTIILGTLTWKGCSHSCSVMEEERSTLGNTK